MTPEEYIVQIALVQSMIDYTKQWSISPEQCAMIDTETGQIYSLKELNQIINN